jgi:hypothetical protein
MVGTFTPQKSANGTDQGFAVQPIGLLTFTSTLLTKKFLDMNTGVVLDRILGKQTLNQRSVSRMFNKV